MPMTQIENDECILVTATRVLEDERMQFLPRVFGHHFLEGESLIYKWMAEICPAYQGGFWEFYSLSSGGFYMAPDMDCNKIHIRCSGNYYDGWMSPDAAGIVATLHGLNALVWTTRDEYLLEMFELLRHYAGDHAEGPEIFGAID